MLPVEAGGIGAEEGCLGVEDLLEHPFNAVNAIIEQSIERKRLEMFMSRKLYPIRQKVWDKQAQIEAVLRYRFEVPCR